MRFDTVLVKRIKRKLRTTINYPVNTLKAYIAVKRLYSVKRENELMIVLTGAIGDSVYGLSFVEAIKKKTPNLSIVAIGHSKWKELLESYTAVDEVRYIDSEEMKRYKGLKAIYGNNIVSEKARKLGIVNGNAFFYKNCYEAKNPDIMYQLRKYVYEVGENASITYHGIKSEDYPIKTIGLDGKKIAILNPYSVSTFSANSTLYEKIARILNINGYSVYTNVVGDQKVITGTAELRCSIYELYSICFHASIIVSARSGILDFVAPTNINMFVIYENCSDRLKKMYHLSNWECKGHIKELYPDNSYVEQESILKEFDDFIQTIQ